MSVELRHRVFAKGRENSDGIKRVNPGCALRKFSHTGKKLKPTIICEFKSAFHFLIEVNYPYQEIMS